MPNLAMKLGGGKTPAWGRSPQTSMLQNLVFATLEIDLDVGYKRYAGSQGAGRICGDDPAVLQK